MDHHENKHCVEKPWSQWFHYRSLYACGQKDAFDRIEVMPARGRYPSLAFEMPRQRHELEKVDSMLKLAYERGQADAKAAIGQMMRDLIAL